LVVLFPKFMICVGIVKREISETQNVPHLATPVYNEQVIHSPVGKIFDGI
jgi:hypothetical protein